MKSRVLKLATAMTVVTVGAVCLFPAMAQDVGSDTVATTSPGIPFGVAMDMAVKAVYGVLGVISVGALALILYALAVLRKGAVVPRRLRSELVAQINAGDLGSARRICEMGRGPLASVAQTALDHVESLPDGDPMLLRDVIESEGARQSEAIQGQAQYLMDIAVVAPMIGLLGTVFGMMIAFNAVSDQIAVVRPTLLVAGVNKAMLTTALGLVVGIPAMMFYAYFRTRSSKLVALLEGASADLFTALLSRSK